MWCRKRIYFFTFFINFLCFFFPFTPSEHSVGRNGLFTLYRIANDTIEFAWDFPLPAKRKSQVIARHVRTAVSSVQHKRFFLFFFCKFRTRLTIFTVFHRNIINYYYDRIFFFLLFDTHNRRWIISSIYYYTHAHASFPTSFSSLSLWL